LDNLVVIRGNLVESEALRFTPSGVPILKFRLAHRSRQVEAGAFREVSCELDAVAVDADARLLASTALGSELKISGFLDRRGKAGKALVLHAAKIERITINCN